MLNPAAQMGVMDSDKVPDKLLRLFGTDPVHLTDTGYKAIASALAEEFDTPHVVLVRSLTAGPSAPASSSRGQRPPPIESWTLDSWYPGGGPEESQLGRERRCRLEPPRGRQRPLRIQRSPEGPRRPSWQVDRKAIRLHAILDAAIQAISE